MVRRPNGPSGQGRDAPGRPAAVLATAATPALNVPATAIRAVASQGSHTTSGTAAVPSSVTGATSGAATMFAGSE